MYRQFAATGLIVLIAGSGCASSLNWAPKAEELAVADFGPPPTNYQVDIKALLRSDLKNPGSANYRWHDPIQAWRWDGALNGGHHYGWVVPVEVSDQKASGEYEGFEAFVFWCKDGQVSNSLSSGFWGRAK